MPTRFLEGALIGSANPILEKVIFPVYLSGDLEGDSRGTLERLGNVVLLRGDLSGSSLTANRLQGIGLYLDADGAGDATMRQGKLRSLAGVAIGEAIATLVAIGPVVMLELTAEGIAAPALSHIKVGTVFLEGEAIGASDSLVSFRAILPEVEEPGVGELPGSINLIRNSMLALNWLTSVLWTPSDTGVNLYGWYDATKITGLADGAQVASWENISGTGWHAVQATAANRPLYKAVGMLGGPAVEWVSNDSLEIVNILSNNRTHGAVVQFAAGSGAASRAIVGAAALNGASLLRVLDSTGGYAWWQKAGVGQIGNAPTLVTPLGQPVIFAGSILSNAWRLGVDGVNASGSHAQTIGSSSLKLGVEVNSTFPFIGQMREVVICGSLSTPDFQRLEGYLAHHNGTPIALVSHPYRNTPPLIDKPSDWLNGPRAPMARVLADGGKSGYAMDVDVLYGHVSYPAEITIQSVSGLDIRGVNSFVGSIALHSDSPEVTLRLDMTYTDGTKVLGTNNSTLWTPDVLGVSLLHNHIATALTALNGALVPTWESSVIGGLALEQEDAAAQPLMDTTLPALDFANGDFYQVPLSADSRNETIAIMVDDIANTGLVGALLTAETGGREIGLDATGKLYVSLAGVVQATHTTVVSNNATHILVVTLTATDIILSVDGVEQTFANATGAAIGAMSLALGDFAGSIKAFVVSRPALDADDRDRLEGYLAWQFVEAAILVAGHPYKTAAPVVKPPATWERRSTPVTFMDATKVLQRIDLVVQARRSANTAITHDLWLAEPQIEPGMVATDFINPDVDDNSYWAGIPYFSPAARTPVPEE